MKWFKKSLRLRLNDLKIEFKTKIFADNFLSLGNVVRFLAVYFTVLGGLGKTPRKPGDTITNF